MRQLLKPAFLRHRDGADAPSPGSARGPRPLVAAVALGLCLGLPVAQAMYKVVGPDGKVTYTDRAPVESGKVQPLSRIGAAGGSAVPLPIELQQATSRFPVTLYTSANCRPCDNGRTLLQQRGVPFAERTVRTAEDFKAYAAIVPNNEMPGIQIGGQRMSGFSASEWNAYLDAAGYPRQSQLPAGYQQAGPTPLTNPDTASAAAPSLPTPSTSPSTQAPPPPAGNAPPGFRF